MRGAPGTMRAKGARITKRAPGPPISSSCLTHPHGARGDPRLLLHTLASREAVTATAATAATPKRQAPHGACASRLSARLGGHRAGADRGLESKYGNGAQVQH